MLIQNLKNYLEYGKILANSKTRKHESVSRVIFFTNIFIYILIINGVTIMDKAKHEVTTKIYNSLARAYVSKFYDSLKKDGDHYESRNRLYDYWF